MKLATVTVGSGPKHAALIHGITGDGGTWFELAPWIASHGYTVTLVDQRGHGASDRAASYSSAELADDLVETLPQGLDLALGHSLGGRSLSMAVERLLPGKAVYLDPGWVIPPEIVITLPTHDDGTFLTVDELAELSPGVSRAHLANTLRASALFDPVVLEAPNFPLADFLPADIPPVPSLVVVPDPSGPVPVDLQERLRDGGYTVRVIPGGAHDLHIYNLAETKSAIEDWL